MRSRQPWQAAWEKDFAWFGGAMTKHYRVTTASPRAPRRGSRPVRRTTVEEWRPRPKGLLENESHPTLGLTYRDCVYQPMLELLRYLEFNGFINYIVSGGGAILSAVLLTTCTASPERVIGSTVAYALRGERKWRLNRAAGRAGRDRRWAGQSNPDLDAIGRRPILAAGNSNGDLAMLAFTGGRPCRRCGSWSCTTMRSASRVHCRRGKVLDAAQTHNWTTVSMKDTWRTVFPEASNP